MRFSCWLSLLRMLVHTVARAFCIRLPLARQRRRPEAALLVPVCALSLLSVPVRSLSIPCSCPFLSVLVRSLSAPLLSCLFPVGPCPFLSVLLFSIIPNVHKCSQIFPDVSKCVHMIPDVSKCCLTLGPCQKARRLNSQSKNIPSLKRQPSMETKNATFQKGQLIPLAKLNNNNSITNSTCALQSIDKKLQQQTVFIKGASVSCVYFFPFSPWPFEKKTQCLEMRALS